MPHDRAHPHARVLAAVYEDLTSLVRYADQGIVLHPATRAVGPRDPDVIGVAAVLAWERGLIRASGGTLRMDVADIVADDHFGAVLGTLRARFPGGLCAQPFCGLWRFEDGRITEHWENIHDPARLAALTTPHTAGDGPRRTPSTERTYPDDLHHP
ncbi:nuclear transport factor 2 family protein [Streptomyces monticola]|uniref:Nuclear transport factor 2 family protein n=1 Tax=Streptomyces monticola TaxID=2666263 RepID=A0ABW2JRC3_9ACTN